MNLYIINYEFDHKIWSAYFPCESWAEAEKRLAALKATGQIDSEYQLTKAAESGVADSVIKAINTGRY